MEGGGKPLGYLAVWGLSSVGMKPGRRFVVVVELPSAGGGVGVVEAERPGHFAMVEVEAGVIPATACHGVGAGSDGSCCRRR